MPKIKGPIRIRNGFNARKFLEDKIGDSKMKLPFSATGWKSTKNSDLVPGGKPLGNIKEEVKPEKKVKKVKE